MSVRWFEKYQRCPCGKKADGVLRGAQNESYGPHCQRCADRRLKEARRMTQEKEQE